MTKIANNVYIFSLSLAQSLSIQNIINYRISKSLHQRIDSFIKILGKNVIEGNLSVKDYFERRLRLDDLEILLSPNVTLFHGKYML